MTDSEHPHNALPQGYRLQEYELKRVLGEGGFGITYLAFDHNLKKDFAIKKLLPSKFVTRTVDVQWGLERFLDEARTLALFDHRHIVTVHRYFEAHGTAYIVMEYAEGETLEAMLARQGTLSETKLMELVLPLLDGLEVVHRDDVIHRDIKPGNIIVREEDGSPVLVDFGAARQAIGARTHSLTVMWTRGYAPYEQYFERGRQGAWTDIYALGAVCYRALTGEVPVASLDRKEGHPLIPVSQRCEKQASASFLSAIDGALAVDAEDRPQSVAEWRAMLKVDGRQVQEQANNVTEVLEPLPSPRVDDPVPPKPIRWRWLAVVLGIIAVLVGAKIYDDHAKQVALKKLRQEQAAEEARLAAEQAEQQRQEQAEQQRQEQEQQRREQAALEKQRQEEQAVLEKQRQERQPGRRFKECAACPEMVVVPTGSFMMGSPSSEKGRDSDEGPQHRVRIAQPFAVGVYEVTFAEWDACVSAGGCNGYDPADRGWGRGQRPVISVSWNDAQSYVKWLSNKTGKRYRLLSESEWEYVARAGTETPFYFGRTISPNQANYNRIYQARTVEAGSFPSNEYELHDVHGNVDEWVQDCWNDSYLGAPTDGSAWTSGDCSGRVLRGGSWDSKDRNLHLADRDWSPIDYRSIRTGFRVARTF